MTKDALRKLLTESRELTEEFGTEIRPAYAIDITDAGGVQWMIPEKWFFRYLVAFELLEAIEVGWEHANFQNRDAWIDALDAEIEDRILRKCSERYR